MTKFANKIRIETYISEDLYNKISEECKAENSSLSGFVASILKSELGGDNPKGRVSDGL